MRVQMINRLMDRITFIAFISSSAASAAPAGNSVIEGALDESAVEKIITDLGSLDYDLAPPGEFERELRVQRFVDSDMTSERFVQLLAKNSISNQFYLARLAHAPAAGRPVP